MNTVLCYHLRLKRIQIMNTFIVGATIPIFEMFERMKIVLSAIRAREGGSSKIINEIEGKPEFGLTK